MGEAETVKLLGSGPLQGLLLSAIVKQLGGIIGLLSSMCNMHFNGSTLLLT